MQDDAKLVALAERVEKLAGPCFETDLGIHRIIDPKHVALMDADYAEDEAAIRARGADFAKHRLPGLRQHSYRPPAYTASLDAAMTLVPEGWQPSVGQNVHHLHWHAFVQTLCTEGTVVVTGEAIAATPALALTAAALRARAQAAKEAHNG